MHDVTAVFVDIIFDVSFVNAVLFHCIVRFFKPNLGPYTRRNAGYYDYTKSGGSPKEGFLLYV